jgi:hypothetical protein
MSEGLTAVTESGSKETDVVLKFIDVVGAE